MNSSDAQGELLPPASGIVPPPSLEETRAFFEREALRTAEEIGWLKRQVQVQRTLLVGTLLAGLILSGSLNILTLKQMRMVRDQLHETRPRVNQMYGEFRKSEPIIREFVDLGYEVYATEGTARYLASKGIQTIEVSKI